MLKAKEYYKILHFLQVEDMDRFYPVEEYFYTVDEETGEEIPVIYESDSFLMKTNRESFTGFDYAEILLSSKKEYDFSELSLNMSEYVQGYDPVEVLSAENTGTIPVGVPKRVVFRIRKSQTMSEASRNLTNIKSIELVTPCNGDFSIHEVCFRNNNAQFSIEQLDSFYEDGKYYVLSRLHMSEVPPELQDHVYTASAGYGWMSIWEYEARVMNDEQKNAKSYGKWLFAIVDDAIDSYKVAKGIADDEEMFVIPEMVKGVPSKW